MKSDYRVVKSTIHKDGQVTEEYTINKTYYHTEGDYYRHDEQALIKEPSVEKLQDTLKKMLEGSVKTIVSERVWYHSNQEKAKEVKEKENKKVRKRTLDLIRLAASYHEHDLKKTLEDIEKLAEQEKVDTADYILGILEKHLRKIAFEKSKAEFEKEITHVEVMADYGQGLWRRDGQFLGAPIEASELGDENFLTEFDEWLQEYNRNSTFDWDYKSFNRRGLEIATKIKKENPHLKVFYHPVGRNDKYFKRFEVLAR